MSYDIDNKDGQTGPAEWADEPKPAMPATRMFKVVVKTTDRRANSYTYYVPAHSVICEGDAVKFYVYRAETVDGTSVLMGYCNRMLRPYLDVEDVTTMLTLTSTKAN